MEQVIEIRNVSKMIRGKKYWIKYPFPQGRAGLRPFWGQTARERARPFGSCLALTGRVRAVQ